MNKHIRKFSTGKMVLFLFILTNLVYVIMLAVTLPRVADYAGGMKLLDCTVLSGAKLCISAPFCLASSR